MAELSKQSTKVAERSDNSGAPRVLGFGTLLALGINGTVGVGIFFTPNQVAGLMPGSVGALAYALTALLLLPIAFAYAVLGGRFHEDGGPYLWARAAFGANFGFLVGWITYVSSVLSAAAVIAGLGQYLGPELGFRGEFAGRSFAIVCVLVLAGIAATGIRPSAWVWTTLTVLKLMPLLAIVAAFAFFGRPNSAAIPSNGFDTGALARAALIVVFPLQGFEIVPVPSGAAKRSSRSVPFATIGALAVASLLYVALHVACASSVPTLAHEDMPLVAAGHALGGSSLGNLVSLGTNISVLGIAFGMFAMTPRYLLALNDPAALGSWAGSNDKRGVPRRALAITVVLVLLFSSIGALEGLFVLSSLAVLAQYTVSSLSLVRLALRKAPGFSLWQAWPAPFGLFAIAMIARAAKVEELWVMVGILVSGMALFGVKRVFSARELA